MSTAEDEQHLLLLTEDLVQSPQHKAASISSIDFDGLLKKPLRLQEDLAEGCGGQLWPAGMVLARYMLRKKQDLCGCSILELGTGGGLVGLAMALSCSTDQTIHITDQQNMISLMQQNITLNNLNKHVQGSVYDWGSPTPSDLPQHPDIVLAADCVYFEPAFPLLQQTLLDLIGPQTTCYFCFKKRRRADLHFMKTARKIFEVVEVSDDPEISVWSRENIFMYAIKQKKNDGKRTAP